ncbi:MAG: type II secretion system F family protein [Candidatus Moranbacteria bacterium]|nr:type II secretion system F family protein [Candidatus Moranbacteria bacterium]MDD3964775.1 type II secretion system F family protein [Candidatus Moranbacteria bacterium]
MSKFFYTAKNITTGESSGGELEAKDEKSLAQELRSQGLLLTSHKALEEEKTLNIKFFDRFSTVPLKEKMVFTRNLSVMVSSGLTVSRAVQNLSIQTSNARFKGVLTSVYDDVQAGRTLSEGLARFPSVFDELFVNMVSVGEMSGNLEEILDILALQLEKEQDLSSKVKGALIYPAVIVVAMVGISILMLTYILPKITGVFKDMDVTLPATTLFIMKMSDLLRNNAIMVIIFTIIFIIGVKIFAGTTTGKRFFSLLYLYLPIVGGIVIKVNCARFARIYSSLLKSGVSVVTGLGIVSKTLGNVYYQDALAEGIEEVQKGVELSKIIRRYPHIFPILVPQILEVGEETGKTETVLRRLAEFYEEEVSQITKNMSSIIEPILMLVIGGGVGFFAVAMLQPMYSVLENIK